MEKLGFRWADECFLRLLPLFHALIAEGEAVAAGRVPDRARGEALLDQLEKGTAGIPLHPGCRYAEQLRNTRDAWQRTAAAPQPAQMAEDTLLPFLYELREEWYFWQSVAVSWTAMQDYWAHEFVPHHQRIHPTGTMDRAETPEVTIFIPACGHLDHTRRCVESLLRHTDLRGRELLLIDHGSPDSETAAYFAAVPGARVIRFRENVRMLMFSAAFRASRGRYLAFVSNDTVVTAGWLERLLDCLRRHPDGILAAPVTPHTSNGQSLFAAPAEGLDRFAASIGRHGRGDWRQRARIMPVIGLYRVSMLERIGFADRWFSTMEFWDDDLSLRARRAGYRQFLCADVYCDHAGSVTGGGAWKETLVEGRRLFWQKHGLDPWGRGFCRPPGLEDALRDFFSRWRPRADPVRVLALGCGMGDSLFALEDAIRRRGGRMECQHLSDRPADLPDLLRFVHAACPARPAWPEALRALLERESFDILLVDGPAAEVARLAGGGWRAAVSCGGVTVYRREA